MLACGIVDTRGVPVDVDRVPLSAFGLAEDYDAFVGDWHGHARHQLLYAARGALELFTEAGQWVLPAQRAAWIGAGVRHRVTARRPVALRTVYFAPAPHLPDHALRVFAVDGLAREMIRAGARWGPDGAADPVSSAFFTALGGLCVDWCAAAVPGLPVPRSEALVQATALIQAQLAEAPSREAIARQVGLSGRTLARRFAEETGVSWREFVRNARMLRALARLAEPDARVSDVALEVGFDSFSAFSHAFRDFAGESPRDYRAKALSEFSK